MLQVKNLSKYYDKLLVLDRLNFEVKEGEFVSIIGPSGCGKTTLLKLLGGLLEPTFGTIKIEEETVSLALRQQKFGFVFQNPALLPWRTAKKNIELPLELMRRSLSQNSSQSFLKTVGMEGFEDYYPSQLSGGMQQRVALARALIFEPPILLMDEPFGSLDEIMRNQINTELLRIWQAEETKTSAIIFVTHSITEAVFLSDKVIVLTSRPAKIKDIINIDLPRPRNSEIRSLPKYFNLMTCLRKSLVIG